MIVALAFAALQTGTGAPASHASASRAKTAAPAAADSLAIRLGVRVEPETVTVGLPFMVDVRVRAPRGTQIVFPAAPDSASAVQALDRRVISRSPDTSATEVTATYRLAAWDIGSQKLHLGNVVVRRAGSAPAATLRSIPLGDLAVFVRSVAPSDSARRVPKPARGYLRTAAFAWPPWWWVLIAVAALVGLWLLWRWLRRRDRTSTDLDPYSIALRDFARLDALGLLDAGERGRYVALSTEVVRAYLARRIYVASTALTSTELLAALRDDARVPLARLQSLLWESDLVKFARYTVTVDAARKLARAAQKIVADTESADRAARAAAAAAAAAARRVATAPDARRAA
jgi:hypothetical protein